MDVKKLAAVLAATAVFGTTALTTAPALLTQHLLTVSAASLRLDSAGDDVKQLQQNLIRLNYLQSGSDTGTFDANTENGVKNLQTEYNLKSDGIAGTGTMTLIQGLINGTAKIIKVDAERVNVRDTANGSKIVTTVNKDDQLVYDGVEENGTTTWYRVSVGGIRGFICGKYVSTVQVSPANAAVNTNTATAVTADTDSKSLRVTGTILHVRSSASTSAKKLTTLKKGQAFTYSKTKKVNGITWYYIKVNDKTSGWVMGTFVSVLDPAQVSGTLKVTGTVLNVRSDASTDAQKITTLKQGETYSFTDRKSVDGINWYYIQVDSSTRGWVLGTFVTLTQTAAAPSESGSLRVTGTVLNVRSSTSTSSKKLTTLKLGQTMTYSKTKTVDGVKWYYIRVSSTISGWVMGTYAYATPNASATQTTTTTTTTETTTTTTQRAKESGMLKIKGTVVNVRAGAGTGYDAISTVKQKQSYPYTDVQDGWYLIWLSSTQSGWIMGEFVEATPNATEGGSVTTAAGKESGTLTVNASNVNIRSGPGTDNGKLTVVQKDESYTYTDLKDGWYLIKINDDLSGWIKGEFVSATASPTTATTTTTTQAPTTAPPESGSLVITANEVNVRSGIGTDSPKLTTVKKNSTYSYSNAKNGWYFIKVSDTQSGWIMGDFVNATPDAVTVQRSSTTTTTTTTTAKDGNSSSTQSTNTTQSTQSAPTTQNDQPTVTTTTATPKSGVLKITATVVNVRAGAGTGFKFITTVKKGQVLTYTDVDEDWYYIQYSASQSGWIKAVGNAEIVPDTNAKPTEKDDDDAVGTLTITGVKVYIRANSEPSSDKIAEAKQGETFKYYYMVDKYYCIKMASGQTGWVLSTYVKVDPYPTTRVITMDPTEAEETDPSSASLVIATGVSKTGSCEPVSDVPTLSVYAGPGSSYNKVSEIKAGTSYRYTDVKDGWYLVTLTDSMSAWASGVFLEKTPDPYDPNQTEASTASSTSVTETSATTTSSTTQSTTSTTGASETATSSTEATQSTQADGSTTAQASETTKEPTTTTTAKTLGAKVVVGTVKVSKGVLNVRKGAGQKYGLLGTLKNGESVVITEKGSKWHKIKYGTGTGYVSADYIKDIKTTYEGLILRYTTDYYYVDAGKTVDVSLSVGGAAVSYTSSDAAKCPVSSTGVVTGQKPGLYSITAKSGLAIANTCVVVLDTPNTDIQPLKISAEGTKFICNWEGGLNVVLPNGEKACFPYQDPAGYWTIGYGHAKVSAASKSWSEERAVAEFNKDIEAMIGAEYKLTDDKMYLTMDGAMALLNADLNDGPYVAAVNDWAVRNGVKLTQTQFDALVSFCYNMGPELWNSDTTKFYLKSAIISHRDGTKALADQVIEGFCRYTRAGDKHYSGLWYRRRNEAELFLEDDYTIQKGEKFKLPSNITWH